MIRYERDMLGYGATPPNANWPNQARIAVQFVINYEEGGENCILHGDEGSEAFLSEIVGAASWPDQRHWNMESIYEYGARAGFWRLHRLFTELNIPATVYGVATALARSPVQVRAMQDAGWEIASHGLKWVEHKDMPKEEERPKFNKRSRCTPRSQANGPMGGTRGDVPKTQSRLSPKTVDLIISLTPMQMIFRIG